VLRHAVLLALLLAGGSSIEARDSFQEASNGMPACREKAPPTPTTWDRQPVDGSFSFALPSACQSVQVQERSYVHGGLRWQCGKMTVEVVWGIWGRSSFGEGHEYCTTEVGKKLVMVMRQKEAAGLRTVVWYPTKQIHEPLLSAWSTQAEDAQLAMTIVLSGRIAPAK
jgi:hypothetical protein